MNNHFIQLKIPGVPLVVALAMMGGCTADQNLAGSDSLLAATQDTQSDNPGVGSPESKPENVPVPEKKTMGETSQGTSPPVTPPPAPPANPVSGTTTAMNTPNINREALAGRILYHRDGQMFLRRDGKIAGTIASTAPVEGTWWIEGNKFCRKLNGVKMRIGQSCEPVQVSGNKVIFTMADGAIRTYRLSKAQAN